MRAIVEWKALPISICIGGSVFGWLISREESEAVLDRFFELGGRLIDTSDAYSSSRREEGMDSEGIIGAWVRSRGVASDIRVCTKVGLAEDALGLERMTVQRALERSLERVGVPAFEAVLAHSDDPNSSPDEIAEALALVKNTTARHIGISNFRADRAAEVLTSAIRQHLPLVELIQEEYSLAVPSFDASALGAVAAAGSLDLMATGSLAQGFLTGKFHNAPGRVGHRQRFATARYQGEQFERLLSALRLIANGHGTSPASIALRWIMDNPRRIPVASVTTSDQLDAFRQAAEVSLSEAESVILDAASRRLLVSQPEGSESQSQ